MTSIKLPQEDAERDRLAAGWIHDFNDQFNVCSIINGTVFDSCLRSSFVQGWNSRPVRTPPPIEFDPDVDPKGYVQGYVLGAQYRIMCLEETIKVLSKMDPKDAESLAGVCSRLSDENQELKGRSVKDASAEELMGNPKVAALVEALQDTIDCGYDYVGISFEALASFKEGEKS